MNKPKTVEPLIGSFSELMDWLDAEPLPSEDWRAQWARSVSDAEGASGLERATELIRSSAGRESFQLLIIDWNHLRLSALAKVRDKLIDQIGPWTPDELRKVACCDGMQFQQYTLADSLQHSLRTRINDDLQECPECAAVDDEIPLDLSQLTRVHLRKAWAKSASKNCRRDSTDAAMTLVMNGLLKWDGVKYRLSDDELIGNRKQRRKAARRKRNR